ncbi:MAG: O-antigen ligase family protein [Lachnospiraceae bacterium]|nr:O-antigen ligase family protein [Lachnospiraceae bacterium]
MIRDALFNMVNDTAHIKRNAVVQIIIVTIAFVLLMRVFPQGAVKSHTYSRQQAYDTSAKAELAGDAFTSSDKKLQTVWFSGTHLYSVKLYMLCSVPDKDNRSDIVLFRLYDENFSCIYEEECCCGDIEDRGWLKATPDIDVEPERAYYYEVIVPEDCEAKFELPVAERGALGQTENGTLYIDGIINDELSLIADFDYSKELTVFGIILRYALILIAAALLYTTAAVLIDQYDARFLKDFEKHAFYARVFASAVVVCFALFLVVFCVVMGRFSREIADRVCFLIGIIVGTAWLMLALWLRRVYPEKPKTTKLSAGRKLSLIWRNYIQTVCFGILFYELCQYVNADREYYHYTNTRRMLILLAIAFLMMYTEKQFINKFSVLWLLASAAGSAIYCRGFEHGTNERELAALTCGVVVAWGLLLINMLILLTDMLKDRERRGRLFTGIKPVQLIYGLLWIVFSGFMYAYRFEKVWVFTATLPFVTMFFLRLTPASKSRLLKNLTNGILLSFGFVALFCFVHRPHHYWMLYRYGGIFHTVACTGMYLAVVFGAAVGKLFGRLKERGNILVSCPGECFIASASAGYIFLTMSRTAYLAAFVTAALVAALAAFALHKTAGAVCRELGMLLLLVALCIPLVFSAVRMIPAVINDPIRYDLEYQDRGFMIYRGDPIDSDKYMTVTRFFSTLFGRFKTEEAVRGDDEDDDEAWNAYNEARAYLAYTGNDIAGTALMAAVNDDEDDDDDDEDEEEESDTLSNGRLDIFLDYLKALSLEGHENMALVNAEGKEHVHAHNSYLQAAYNFGIIAGVVFLAICAVSLWCSIRLALTQAEKFGIYLVPFTLIVVFGMVSLTEWAFHPCIPAGFCFLFMQPLLISAGRA